METANWVYLPPVENQNNSYRCQKHKVLRSSYKVPDIIFRFAINMKFSTDFFESRIYEISLTSAQREER